MKIPDNLRTVPRSVYVLLFSAVFVISVFYAYFLNEDARLLEKKIESGQRDYAEVLQLRDAYESQKRAFEKAVSKKVENRGISLGVVEEMAAKSFTGGTLAALQPVRRQGRERGAAHERGRESDRRGAWRGHLFCQDLQTVSVSTSPSCGSLSRRQTPPPSTCKQPSAERPSNG